MIRSLLSLLGLAKQIAPPPAEWPEPQALSDAQRLAYAVLDGDEEAALALADLVLETYRRASDLPAGVTFETVAWPRRAKAAFARLKVTTFRALLGTSAAQLVRCPDFGPVTLDQVRAILAGYGLALKGEQP